MIHATQGRGRGEYWPHADGGATYYCPQCGLGMDLSSHTINSDGIVSPSVVHPKGYGCDALSSFHDHLTLDGWPKPDAGQARTDAP